MTGQGACVADWSSARTDAVVLRQGEGAEETDKNLAEFNKVRLHHRPSGASCVVILLCCGCLFLVFFAFFLTIFFFLWDIVAISEFGQIQDRVQRFGVRQIPAEPAHDYEMDNVRSVCVVVMVPPSQRRECFHGLVAKSTLICLYVRACVRV